MANISRNDDGGYICVADRRSSAGFSNTGRLISTCCDRTFRQSGRADRISAAASGTLKMRLFMSKSDEYEAAIAKYDTWGKLESLWKEIRSGGTTGWPEGKAFEYLVLQAFKLDGGTVRWPYSVRVDKEEIEQIDGVVHIGRFSCVVESKHTAKAIAIAPLAKLRNQLLRRHSGTIGLVFSYSGFTNPALLLAQYIAPQSILLWNGEEVEQIIKDQKVLDYLEFKYRTCVETGLPDASIQTPAAPTPVPASAPPQPAPGSAT